MRFIDELIARGGPESHEYAAFTAFVDAMAADIASGAMAAAEAEVFWRELTEQNFRGTAQAHALLAPHGYHGDYEIIDIIYRQRVAPEPYLERWDHYFHAQSAPKAVRNRKGFFHALLDDVVGRHPGEIVQVLNVASGPGRDMQEWLDTHPHAPVLFDCVELDPNAIEICAEPLRPLLGENPISSGKCAPLSHSKAVSPRLVSRAF